jgi:hypothetical protein
MTGILATIIIYIFLLLTSHWFKREFCIQESRFIIACQHTSLSKDPEHFKLKLKSFLLEQSLYSLEEFYQVTSKEFYPMYDM